MSKRMNFMIDDDVVSYLESLPSGKRSDMVNKSLKLAFKKNPLDLLQPIHDMLTQLTINEPQVASATQTSLERVCCANAQPCQHWSFNGDEWVNSLSGRKKEE